jgi:hypothetical protein
MTSLTPGDPTPGHEPRRSASGDIGGDSDGGDLGVEERRVLVGEDDMMSLLPVR